MTLFTSADSFEDQTFDDLELDAASIEGKEFFRCTFRNAKLPESRWLHCSFEACSFIDCDLTRMKLLSSALRGVTFTGCKLLGADFSQVSANPDVTLDTCILRYFIVDGQNLRAIRFSDCELQDGQFSETSLIESDFIRCDLTGCSFSRCDLGGADFSTSHGLYFDPRQNKAKDAFLPVESAVLMAQALGLRVEGYNEAAKRKRRTAPR